MLLSFKLLAKIYIEPFLTAKANESGLLQADPGHIGSHTEQHETLLWKEVCDEKLWEKSDSMNNLHSDDKWLDTSHFAIF